MRCSYLITWQGTRIVAPIMTGRRHSALDFVIFLHYNDIIMSTSLTIVYSVYWGPHQRKHQISASLAFLNLQYDHRLRSHPCNWCSISCGPCIHRVLMDSLENNPNLIMPWFTWGAQNSISPKLWCWYPEFLQQCIVNLSNGPCLSCMWLISGK